MVIPSREYDGYIDDAFAARSKKLLARIKEARVTVKLRFDGRYTFITDEDNRQWTILSHFIGPEGLL